MPFHSQYKRRDSNRTSALASFYASFPLNVRGFLGFSRAHLRRGRPRTGGMDALVRDALAGVTATNVGTCGVALAIAFALKFVASDILGSISCRHIPCPAGRLPFLGHALMLLRGNVWDTFTRLSQQYGSIYRMHVLGRVFIVLADPGHIKHVLSNIKNFRKDRGTYEVFNCLLGTGIVTSEGERWHRLRRELAPTFKLEILEDVARAAEDVTVRLYAELDRACESGEEVDMAEHFRKLTLQVIALAVLGCTPDESDSKISDLYMPIIDECNDRIWYPHRIYLPTPAWWAHNRLVRNLNSFLEEKIRSRWTECERLAGQAGRAEAKDILDRILAGVDPEEFRKDGVRDLRDGLKTFLFAGHDTTSCMLTWTLWELMKAPEVMQAAVQEATAFFHDRAGGAKADFDTVSNGLPYMFNCLRETLRLRSPVPVVTREIVKSDEIGGVAVPAGAVALICMDAVHKRSDLWPQGDTDVFRPTRCAALLRVQVARRCPNITTHLSDGRLCPVAVGCPRIGRVSWPHTTLCMPAQIRQGGDDITADGLGARCAVVTACNCHARSVRAPTSPTNSKQPHAWPIAGLARCILADVGACLTGAATCVRLP